MDWKWLTKMHLIYCWNFSTMNANPAVKTMSLWLRISLIIRQPRFIKRLCLVPPKWFLKLASTFFFKGHGWKKLLLQPIPHTLNHNLHRHLFTSRSPTRMNNGCIDPTRLFTTLLVFEFHWKLGAYGSKQYRSPTCLLWQQIVGDCSTKRPSSNINSEWGSYSLYAISQNFEKGFATPCFMWQPFVPLKSM